MILLQYILLITVAILLIIIGIKGAFSPKKTREEAIKKNEKSWYFTKTKLGRSTLKYEKERKSGFFDTWISSVAAIAMGLLMLYVIINDILKNGWPT